MKGPESQEVISIEDTELIRLYQTRSEGAITASEKKYGAYCRKIAQSILGSDEDAAECVNDVWLKACPNAEISLIDGGQPVYYYLISAE